MCGDVIKLTGSAHERGIQHGKMLKGKIEKHLTLFKNDVKENLKMDLEPALKEFYAETDFISAIRKWTPDLLDEMNGISEGSGVEFDNILALNLIDEYWWFAYDKKGAFVLPSSQMNKCSSLGVHPENGNRTIVAQNLDVPGYFDGLQVMQYIQEPDSGFECFAFSFAGVVGAVGMNNHGVAMCENTLMELVHAGDGLPVVFVSRGIMAQPSLKDAIEFVKSIKHASGQNYVIGDTNGLIDLECSANKVNSFSVKENPQVVYHTNHAFENDERYIQNKDPENSKARFQCLANNMNGLKQPVDLEAVKSVLRSHDSAPFTVCSHPTEEKPGLTACSLIMELFKTPRLHYTFGPPCEKDYQTLSF